MISTKKLLQTSVSFLLLLNMLNQPHALTKEITKKNNKHTKEKNSKGTKNDLTIPGKLTVTGSSTFNDKIYAKKGFQITKGDLSVSNSSNSKKVFTVNSDSFDYSGNNASLGNYVFDLVKNQSINKPYYSGQISSSAKKALRGLTRSTNLQIFPISFVELLNDTTYTALHGAYLNIKAIIGGTIDSSPVEAFYNGELYILPTTSENAPDLTIINQSTTTLVGDAITFSATVTGTGTSTTLYLTSEANITNPEISYYYEAVSNNISSLG